MNKHNTYIISGYGVCLPKAPTLDAYWDVLSNTDNTFSEVHLFGEKFPAQTVSTVDEIPHGWTRRQTKKLDRFTLLSVAAMRQVVENAKLPLDDEAFRERCGIILGNNTGGWTFVEPQMSPLYDNHMNTLSPYVATAWFPTAVQGELSIFFGLGGYSKTFSAGNLSAGFAFEHALAMLDAGVVSSCLVGGTEAPLNGLVYNACMKSGLLSEDGSYQPYTAQADGIVLGEGASLFMLESEDTAIQRGAQIHARVAGIGKGLNFTDAMQSCLHSAGQSAKAVQAILLSASAKPNFEQAEYTAIAEVFAGNTDILMSAPKAKYGNILGADMAADIATACLSLQYQSVVPTSGDVDSIIHPGVGRHVAGVSDSAAIRQILINGQDTYGQCMSLLLAAI
jgi:3-oxoacyl-(acyl-carrier-protein) synthase